LSELKLTTIKVRKETRDALKSVGKKGETYDEIINRLLDRALRRKRVEAKGGETRVEG
jgi:hypothetical protein